MNKEFMNKFNPEINTIKEFNYWTVLLREKQVTLGAAIIILNREIPSVSEMLSEEAAEFPIVAKWFEKTTRELYGAEKFNYIIAMMKDDFVHYHAIPRYSKNIDRYNMVWKDTCWPGIIELKSDKTDKAILELIKTDMRQY